MSKGKMKDKETVFVMNRAVQMKQKMCKDQGPEAPALFLPPGGLKLMLIPSP